MVQDFVCDTCWSKGGNKRYSLKNFADICVVFLFCFFMFPDFDLEVLIRVNLHVKFILEYSERVIVYNFTLQSTFLTNCLLNHNERRFS